MIIGLNLPNYSRLGYRASVVTIAQTAEALGYASLWTNDHVLIPTSRPEPFGNISHLSGGRLALAVGVGYIQEEYGYLRADFSNRGRLADEYISAMRELFESERPEFHGPHINYADVLFAPRPSPRIPILVGGDSPAALKRAAALGDGWYGLRRSPDQVREAMAQINSFGHKWPFEVSLRVLTRVGGIVPDGESEATLHGEPEAILKKIQDYSEAGVDRIVIEPVSSDLDDFLRQLSRFADEITPHIARTSANTRCN
jgi:alkanesulfonate monooxygenase SsuD/methylene tetrahydromethanopterin reductase-like flavin-dependent oxidoreductase (luciferase family)